MFGWHAPHPAHAYVFHFHLLPGQPWPGLSTTCRLLQRTTRGRHLSPTLNFHWYSYKEIHFSRFRAAANLAEGDILSDSEISHLTVWEVGSCLGALCGLGIKGVHWKATNRIIHTRLGQKCNLVMSRQKILHERMPALVWDEQLAHTTFQGPVNPWGESRGVGGSLAPSAWHPTDPPLNPVTFISSS